jgi:hypothetical protein
MKTIDDEKINCLFGVYGVDSFRDNGTGEIFNQ